MSDQPLLLADTDALLVASMRRMRAPWQDVAKALGHSIDYTRAIYDGGYQPVPLAPRYSAKRREPAAPARPPAPRGGRFSIWFGGRAAAMMRLLHASADGVSASEIGVNPKKMMAAIRVHFGGEELFACKRSWDRNKPTTWALTEKGRQIAERHYGCAS